MTTITTQKRLNFDSSPESVSASVTFAKKMFYEVLIQMKARLSGSAAIVLEYFCACATFVDQAVFLPSAKKIAETLGIPLSTFYNALKRIEKSCPFIQIQTCGSMTIAVRTDPGKPKKILDFNDLESFTTQKNHFQKFVNGSQNLEIQHPEPMPDKDLSSPKTIKTVQTLQTGQGVDEKVNKEVGQDEVSSPSATTQEELPKEVVEKQINKQEKKDIKYTVLPNHREKKKVPPAVIQKKYDIPDDLLEKLKMFEIKTSEEVLVKISEHHISQAYCAVAHIENTFETIRDKTAVFLYQLPKQPIEKLGQRHSDELLEKQKQEVERIAKEKEDPGYFYEASNAFGRIKQIFERNSAKKKGAKIN